MTWAMPLLAMAAAQCTPVSGPRILGADLERAGLLAGLPSGAVAAFSPAPGVRRTLVPSDLRRIALKYGLPVPERTGCFEREMASLDSGAVSAAMRAALGDPGAEVSIVEISRYPAPHGEIVFLARDLQPPRADGTSLWRGHVRYDATRRFPIWVRARVSVATRHVVAIADIAAGERIGPGRLRLITRPRFPGKPAAPEIALEAATGLRARRRIAARSTVSADMLESDPEVEKGETVEVRVTQGATRLSISAKAESSAVRGQIVAVRNPASGKLFRGRVEGRRLVVVGQ